EEKLVELWNEVLMGKRSLEQDEESQPIGIDDNFFQLGGHSLKATELTLKIHKRFNVIIPLAEVFKTPTIRALAATINNSAEETFASIPPAEKKSFYPLSSAQKRLYFLQAMEPDSTVYNMPATIPLVEEPYREKLEDTIIKLIRRHESLRTSFHIINEEPVQAIHETVKFNIDYFETDGGLNKSRNLHNKEKVEDELSIQNSFNRPFDLSRAPLVRAVLIKVQETGNNRWFLLVDMHHIISDGISHEILQKDFNALYMGKELPPLRIQYKDYSEWQHNEMEIQNLKQQETYWLEKYEGELPVLNIPTDYSAPLSRSFEGSIFNFQLDADVTAAVRQLVLEENSTTFIVLMAVFNLFLSKQCRQDDIVVGTPVASRRHADLEPVIGMFVNALALRNRVDGKSTFVEFLGLVKANTLEAFENQDYQFEDLVEKVVTSRDKIGNPIFNVLFAVDEIEPDNDRTGQTDTETVPADAPYSYSNVESTAKFDLTLNVAVADVLHFNFEYSTRRFKKETIVGFAESFKEILTAVLQNKSLKLEDINMTDRFDAASYLQLVERRYWFDRLTGEPVKSHFLPDYKRNKHSRRQATVEYGVPETLFSQLMRISKGAAGRVFIVLSAGLTTLIHRYSDNDDIIIGAPVDKGESGGKQNFLLIKNTINRDMTFKQLLARMKDTIVEAIKYRDYPVEVLARQLVKPFAADEDFPLFDVSILLDNIHDKNHLLKLNHNMAFSFSLNKERLTGRVDYNRFAYSQSTIQRITGHFMQLLTAALSNPDTGLADVDMISEEEKNRLMSDFNDSSASYPRAKTVHELFQDRVDMAPDAVALVYDDSEAKGGGILSLSYRQLNERAHRLANELMEKGVEPGQIVPVMISQPCLMVTGMMAILKTGAAYLPIDKNYPLKRKKIVMADSAAELLVTEKKLVEKNSENQLAFASINILYIDSLLENAALCAAGAAGSPAPVRSIQPDDMMYIMYTSGSTGKPKGVVVEHRHAVNVLHW
ncbi:MAG: AMP-binding protein, partial [bacterium]|nr:AMP-binding protein [bacterium]